MKAKEPTIQQNIDLIHEYGVAREQELSQQPKGGWPADYKNPLMENLYDAANHAAIALTKLQGAAIAVAPRK